MRELAEDLNANKTTFFGQQIEAYENFFTAFESKPKAVESSSATTSPESLVTARVEDVGIWFLSLGINYDTSGDGLLQSKEIDEGLKAAKKIAPGGNEEFYLQLLHDGRELFASASNDDPPPPPMAPLDQLPLQYHSASMPFWLVKNKPRSSCQPDRKGLALALLLATNRHRSQPETDPSFKRLIRSQDPSSVVDLYLR